MTSDERTAVSPDAAPGPAARTRDPVFQLLRAEQDGLLTYEGYATGDRFEVVIAGTRTMLARRQALATADRLQRIHRLAGTGVTVALAAIDCRALHMTLDVAGELIPLPAVDVPAWLDGYEVGCHEQDGPHPPHTLDQQVGNAPSIRTLLTEPTPQDARRLVILGLMYGGDTEMSMEQLRVLVDRTKKAVVDALVFGGTLTDDMSYRMIRAFRRRWKGPDHTSVVGIRPVPEMPGIARLRRVLRAVDDGIVSYVDTADVNQARWQKEIRLAVGSATHVLPAADVVAWLDGLTTSARVAA